MTTRDYKPTASLCTCLAATAALSWASPTLAHHSYAMFDIGRTVTVTGTIAKVEWSNPHMSVWVYVPDTKQKSGYTLYAFETGGTGMMLRMGWNKSSLSVGEKVILDYHPLKDGRPGGSFVKAMREDGATISGDPGPEILRAEGRRRAGASGDAK